MLIIRAFAGGFMPENETELDLEPYHTTLQINASTDDGVSYWVYIGSVAGLGILASLAVMIYEGVRCNSDVVGLCNVHQPRSSDLLGSVSYDGFSNPHPVTNMEDYV